MKDRLSKDVILNGIKQYYPTDFFENLVLLNGIKVYVYGGIPRDLIMGRDWKDVDLRIIIDADWDEREEILDKFFEETAQVELKLRYYDLDGGFTLYRVLPHGSLVDLYLDCSVTYSVDACPPDYTVSGIYVDLKSGEVVNPYNGIRDISSQVVRPAKPFKHLVTGDPLSPFAAAKLAVKLNFRIDETFKSFIADNCTHVRQIFEYIRLNGGSFRNEVMLAKLFDGFKYDPERYCGLLKELGLTYELATYLELHLDEPLYSKWQLERITFQREDGFERNLSRFLSALTRCFKARDQKIVFQKIKRLLTLDAEKKYGEFYIKPDAINYEDSLDKSALIRMNNI